MSKKCFILAVPFLLAVTAAANATAHNYAAFNPSPANTTTTWRGQLLSGAPADTYVGYQVLADWVGGNTGTSGQWSDESRIYLGSTVGTGTGTTPTGAGTAYTTAARLATNGTNNNFDVPNLRFRGGLNTNFAGGANNLAAHFRQTFTDVNSGWSNIRVSVYSTIDEALGVTDLGTITPGTTSSTVAYARSDAVRWFKFTLGASVTGASSQYLSIDSLGNTLAGGEFGDNDTEIGLFNSAGTLISSNDDFSNPTLQGESLVLAGSQASSGFPTATGFGNAGANLAAGTYYIALGTYNTAFSAPFIASNSVAELVDGADLSGDFKINISTNVPEPATLALLAFGAVGVVIRRRTR